MFLKRKYDDWRRNRRLRADIKKRLGDPILIVEQVVAVFESMSRDLDQIRSSIGSISIDLREFKDLYEKQVKHLLEKNIIKKGGD